MTAGEIKAILEKLKEVEQGATEGLWISEYTAIGRSDLCTISGTERCEMDKGDADFFALARTAMPVLREAVERLHGLRIEGLQVVYKPEVNRIIADALAPLKELINGT